MYEEREDPVPSGEARSAPHVRNRVEVSIPPCTARRLELVFEERALLVALPAEAR